MAGVPRGTLATVGEFRPLSIPKTRSDGSEAASGGLGANRGDFSIQMKPICVVGKR